VVCQFFLLPLNKFFNRLYPAKIRRRRGRVGIGGDDGMDNV